MCSKDSEQTFAQKAISKAYENPNPGFAGDLQAFSFNDVQSGVLVACLRRVNTSASLAAELRVIQVKHYNVTLSCCIESDTNCVDKVTPAKDAGLGLVKGATSFATLPTYLSECILFGDSRGEHCSVMPASSSSKAPHHGYNARVQPSAGRSQWSRGRTLCIPCGGSGRVLEGGISDCRPHSAMRQRKQ